ncbi:hypothetical protein ACHAWF_002709, partial [Thalassiosira exigua]
CSDCASKLGRGWFGLGKVRSDACTKCQKTLCLQCAGDQALIPFDENVEPLPLEKSSIKSYCRSCFKDVSVLDFGKSYDIIEPPSTAVDPDKPSITLLWAHGGGASRALFRPHASALTSKGYRSVLFDLPGHGTMVDTSLTLDSCVEAVMRILDETCSRTPSKLVYVGGSLGAYIGFHILGRLKERFAGAILLDCGQNVGPDCSLKARVGIWFLRKLSGRMNNKALMGAMMGEVSKSKADYHLVECCYGGGVFFQQGPAQCDCMHSVAPADIIPSFHFPVLFFNGSEDYRDSENKWLDLCNDRERSALQVYEGGDHFFCHDSRFVDDILRRMDDFIQSLA